ncbi:MAG: hypothetical protein R2745_04625 [Vicinamibacterales bacterium]
MTAPVDPVAEIKRLYYGTTRSTIARDLERAIGLLKALPTEDERERAAVYMDGLAQMRSEWQGPTPPARPAAGTRVSRRRTRTTRR